MGAALSSKLRHRVILQQAVEAQDNQTGAVDPTVWDDIATLWASIEPLSAREFIAAQAENNKVTAKIVIKYRANINGKMRFFHQATGAYYNIEGILADKESGREYLTIPVSEGVRYQDETAPS